MKTKGKVIDISKDYKSNQFRVTFLVESEVDVIEEIQSVPCLDIEAKEHKEKRSLDANAYCWCLIGKLAKKLNIKPIEVYREQIKNTPVYEIVPIRDEAIERFTKGWEKNGLGWIVVNVGESKFRGFHNLQVFYGSSAYNTQEMSQLINNIVEECKIQGIETKTPEEIKSLIACWEENDRKA